MKRTGLLALMMVFVAAAPGQGIGEMPLPVPVRLAKFLDLTRDQILEIGRLQLEWQRYIASKTRRVAQVERELREVTLAPTVDPSALGVRYMELEAICREARDTEARIRERARQVLTEAQRAKLGVLEEAYRLLPYIAEADALHLVYAPLPGLNLALTGPRAPRPYPGCRYWEPEPLRPPGTPEI